MKVKKGVVGVKIRFLGAAKCVTGSCHMVSIEDVNILFDCGMFQSNDEEQYDNEKIEFEPENINFLVLSHSHVDHSGRIPFLFKKGFKGRVLCTKPTIDLCECLLKDAAKIQGEETYFENLDRQKKGLEALQPIYEIGDVEEAIKHFEGFEYGEIIKLTDTIQLKFEDAGHILGSAICELFVNEPSGKVTKLIFSGDIGNKNKDILKDPKTGFEADYLIMESTYGDKSHDVKDVYPQFLQIAKNTMEAGGNLIIPCFSLGRTQEIIYMLNKFVEEGKLQGCSVYIDSPLASSLTEIFKKYEEYFDKAAQRLIEKGDDPLNFEGLHFVRTNEEAQEAQNVKEKAIIIVAGGLHEGGRVANHLKNNLTREECGVIITSYQGRNSLGSRLLKGEKKVRISGEDLEVKAKVHYMGGLSCHADKDGLLQWISGFTKKPEKVFLVHGEEENIQCFNEKLVQLGYDAITVDYLQEIDMNSN